MAVAKNKSKNIITSWFSIEFRESLKTKWFLLYFLLFGGAVVFMFTFGIADSQIWGITGLTRFVVIYTQLCLVVLPIMTLIVTVRAITPDRESLLLEYLLSYPIGLGVYFWGKVLTRFSVIFVPVIGAFIVLVVWGLFREYDIPWHLVFYFSGLLIAMNWCFSGIGILISVMVRRQEQGNALAFLVWLGLIALLDFVLIGLLLRYHVAREIIVGLSLMNPIQVFRVAVIASFDPQLSLLGPSSYLILDTIGTGNFMIFALTYPLLLGFGLSWAGYRRFRKSDLI